MVSPSGEGGYVRYTVIGWVVNWFVGWAFGWLVGWLVCMVVR